MEKVVNISLRRQRQMCIRDRILLGGLHKSDVVVTDNPENADTIIINTCGFLDIAREESVDTILQAAELKKTGRPSELVVMGCLSERYPEELTSEVPDIDQIFGSNDHRQIISFLTGKDFSKDDPLFFRSLMTPNHYAYIKIAEGCDNGCSFCSIPIMRGLQKSRTIPAIMEEAIRLAENGTKELLVIAQDSTSYGWDLDQKVYLSDLLKNLNRVDGIEWIRVHYAHPAHLSQRIIDSIADSDKVCNYLDMPVQHASDIILKSMKRGLNQEGIRDRINRLRDASPGIAIRTTLIVGYPGETEEDFTELFNFVKDIRFDRLGVFTYSEEEGTSAAHLDDNIPQEVKNDRKNQIIELQHDISLARNESFIGKNIRVLVDQTENNIGVGRTEYDSPEIDNIVQIEGEVSKGKFVNVNVNGANEYELIGKPVD